VNNPLNSALFKAACGVFEELTFMLASRELDEVQSAAPFDLAGAVEFQGPMNGTLLVGLYGPLIASIAGNMLGEMELPTEDQQKDAMKELTNILCGNLMPQLAGNEAVFKIGVPRVLDSSELQKEIQGGTQSDLQIGLEQGRVALYLILPQNNSRS
jgi:CheY-specific phosphatase CheX